MSVDDFPFAVLTSVDVRNAQPVRPNWSAVSDSSKPTVYAKSPLTPAATRSNLYALQLENRDAIKRKTWLTSSQPLFAPPDAPSSVTGSFVDHILSRGSGSPL
jgi:hypothetical protein